MSADHTEEPLDLVARYSGSDGRYSSSDQIEITGNASVLVELADLLICDNKWVVRPLTVPSQELAAPYDGFLSQLRRDVRDESDEKLLVKRRDDELYICGSPPFLELLAQNIRFLAEDKSQFSGNHLHVEYYPDHFFLSSASDALIFERSE
jgi:hypothetical protein